MLKKRSLFLLSGILSILLISMISAGEKFQTKKLTSAGGQKALASSLKINKNTLVQKLNGPEYAKLSAAAKVRIIASELRKRHEVHMKSTAELLQAKRQGNAKPNSTSPLKVKL